jgi:cell division septation protein DedD
METLQAASSPSDTSDANTVTEPVDSDGNTQNAAPAPKAKQAVLTPAPASKPSPASAAAVAPPATVKQASLPVAAVNNPTPVSGNGAIMVQIAAVSHQEDANALVSALRQHGYTVSVRNEPQDKLLHVQVGPFPTRDAAKATRAKLLADGYNAILKP